ncbi:hypothetical protein FLP10_07350 [Agromyces intestinalis]|uniref:Carbohydrate kinase FGGY C-terminal domain-containing protein n=1 Tax=Agromyces intestinalis TaxID=2592652 RepID=A0A5C1YHL0_9MICO|nr:FGGY-family carbohydrate kinase [Agromyces intestinalis]QEO14252.1 hypothetical protein FLP10_07350 [Agromyces intestinalis]
MERLCFDRLAQLGAPLSGRFSSSGGGTHSLLWNRVRASLLGRALALPESAEASLGMALLAAWGHSGAQRPAGGEASGLLEIARRMSRVRTVVDPEPALAARLEEHYGRFRAQLGEMGWMPR